MSKEDMKTALLSGGDLSPKDGSPKKNIKHAGTVNLGELGTGSLSTGDVRTSQKLKLQKRWTFASADDLELQHVKVDDCLNRTMAAQFTVKDIAEKNKLAGKVLRRVTAIIGAAAPDEDMEEEQLPSAEGDDALKCTNGEAMMNLLNNCLGSGMLGMGFCIAQTGLIGGLLCMLFSAALNRRTLMLNIKSCQYAGCKPASTEVGSISYGLPGRLLLVLMVVLLGFFCMVSYVDASADAVTGLLTSFMGADAKLPSTQTIAIICWVVLLVPPTLIRSMSMVAMLSFIAFSGGIVIVVGVSAVCLELLFTNGLPSFSQIRLFPESPATFLNAFPILMLVFSVQAGGDVVLVTMKDTSEKNMYKVLDATYAIVLVMLYWIGALCYLTWLDDTQGDVLKNFSSSSMAGLLARIASLDLVVLSYTIMIIPCKVSLIDLIFGKNEAFQESTPMQFYGTTMCLNVAALGVALAVSDLSLVLGIDGAVCTNFVAFMLPAAFWTKVQSKPADPKLSAVPMYSPKNAVEVIIFIIGFFFLFTGTYQVIQRAEAGG